ncbi:hypothetical protein AX14_013737 [Amanita brunnescens Koide BX004]|nr:hypothetical protein AX14_013737 [Amanita brunnescens Koide BX004]
MIFYVSWLALVAATTAVAQSSNANCSDSSYDWVFNSKGQSPCEVVEDLATACDPNGFTLQPISPGTSYNGPGPGQNNTCHCTSIFYSLISACAACQDGSWTTWTEYLQNCSSFVYLSVYPKPIPPDTSVPHWAYLNVSASHDLFNIVSASSAVGAESTGIPVPTARPKANPSSHSPRSPRPGVIAGAVIGSIFGTLLLMGLLYGLYRRWLRYHQTRNDGAESLAGQTRKLRSASPPSTLPTVSSPPLSSPGTSPPPRSDLHPRKYYDPDDPTTHPDAIFGRMGSFPEQPYTESVVYTGQAEPA